MAPAVDLRTAGWTEEREAAFAESRASGLVPGRIVLEHNHIYRVLVPQAGGDLLAEVAGRMKHRAEGRHELPAVGDWVAVRPGASGTRAVIEAVLPRRSQFTRKVAGRETEQQVVAANIDLVLLVFGLDGPLKTRSIERFLVGARQSGARPVVVLSKSDLCDDVAGAVAEVTAVAEDAAVLAVSTRSADGLAPIRGLGLIGRTLALLGPSGAGKSSIVNVLAGRDVIRTGEVRSWDARGRHTSVHRQLVFIEDGGALIDTPGLRELQLWEVESAVDEAFADIAALAESCRFRDCRHNREPGCAVKAAVDSGQLPAARYENYLKLQAEQQAFEARRDERGQMEAKRQARLGSKAMKRLERDRDR